MKNILYLINLLEKTSSITDFISKVGELKKTFRGMYFIIPNNPLFEAISVGITNKKIDWVGVSLKEPLPIDTMIENYGYNFHKGYNYYDEETVFTFRGEKNVCLSCYLDGYVSFDETTDMKFSRLQISTISQR